MLRSTSDTRTTEAANGDLAPPSKRSAAHRGLPVDA